MRPTFARVVFAAVAATIAVTITAAASTALLSAFTATCEASAPEVSGPTISLGMLPVVDNLPFFVAEEEGLFAAHGAKVKLVPFSSAIERDTALRAGAIDGCLADIVMAALSEASGTDISIVSLGLGASPLEGRFAVLAAPGSDLASLKGLKGGDLGISRNTIAEYVADELLSGAGLSEADVRKIDIPKLPIRVEMLLSGRLSAAVLPDPMATYAIARGAKRIADDTTSSISQTVIVFRAATLSDKPKATAVREIMAAYAEGAARVNAAPERYRDLLASTAGLPEQIRQQYAIDHYPPPQLPAKTDVSRVLRWMVSKHLLKKMVPLADLLDASFLPSAGSPP